MRRKRHPLEIYQRGRPFAQKSPFASEGTSRDPDSPSGASRGLDEGAEPPVRKKKSGASRPSKKARPASRSARGKRGSPGGSRAKAKPRRRPQVSPAVVAARARLRKWGGRIGSLPLQKTVIPLSALVLVVLGFYAVGFWWLPQKGESSQSTPALESRNEWPDRFGGGEQQPPTPEPLCCIKVASGRIPADGSRQSEVLRRWLEDESRLNEDLEANFPDRGVRAKAVRLGEPSNLEAALLVGPWPHREDPELEEILGWIHQTYTDATVVRTEAHVFAP